MLRRRDGLRSLPARRHAEREGVVRPFEILVSMDPDSRARIAAHLGVRISHLEEDPSREAWAILHRDLRGMQARGHVALERLLPIRNITWIEMLRRTARWLRIPADGTATELERRIYEAFADRIVATWRPEEISLCDAMASVQPWVLRLRERLALSRNGVRLAVGTFATMSWTEALGVGAAVASTLRFRHASARAIARGATWLDAVARRVPPLRPALWIAAQAAALAAMVLTTHHDRNAPVVMTLVLQSFQTAAAEPTVHFWNSV
ncbi:MAG TPA: hypothetical protein VKE69_01195 [Planctomycetota bacterium]|nr:hypothetical protein [Planctomycetota bacterium]